MKKLISITIILTMAAAMLSGCGSSANSNGSQPDVPNQPPSQGAGTSPGTPADPGVSAGSRSDIIIAIDSDITTLHPCDYATSNEARINDQIYEHLMYAEGGILYPRLAESWEVGADGMTYTLHLVKGVTFHDGSPFTATDVKFSCELYQESAYQGASVDGLKSVDVVDDHTVILKTSTVFSPFLENLAAVRISSKSYFDSAGADKFAGAPIGCGAYQFVSRDLGSKITLRAFDDYYRGAPAIKDVIFRVLTDNATITMSLQAGEVDFVNIRETSYADLIGYPGIIIQEVPMSRFGFISLNHEKYPFSEVKFRQAVAYAIDRQNLIDLAMDGIGIVNSNLISPLRFGWSADQPEYTYNPDKAKALLAEIGIQTPYDLGILPVAEQYKTQAEVIQSDLSKVGLIVQIEVQEFNALLGSLFNGDIGITTMQMSLEGVTQTYAMALTSPYVGMANNVRYSNPEIDALFERAVEAVDENARFAIYDEIFTRVQEEAVFVILFNTVGLYAYSNQLIVPVLALEGDYFIFDLNWK